jgi:hypothetical protein
MEICGLHCTGKPAVSLHAVRCAIATKRWRALMDLLWIAGQSLLFEKRGMTMMETLMKILSAIGPAATACDPLTIDSAKYEVPDPEPGEKPDTTPAEKSPGTFPQPGFKWRSLRG